MKKISILFALLLSVLVTVSAQDLKIEEIELNNLGDGRLFGRDKKKDKPLEGKTRIITGYTTEYIDAQFAKGLAEGKWEYYKDNTLAEVRNYSGGNLHGELIRYYPDGTTVREKTTLKNGKVEGITTLYSQNGTLIQEKGMKEGVDDGPERKYNEETGEVLSETIYKEGKAEGKSFSRINFGSHNEYLITAYYKDGKYEGEYSEVYADGTVKTKGQYAGGAKEGLWESFKADGDRKGPAEVYEKGKVIKRTTFYTDGSVESERHYNAHGKQHGTEKKYAYEGGHLTAELNYVNGKQVGKQLRLISSNQGAFYEHSTYNESGKKEGEYKEVFEGTNHIKSQGKYQNDKKHGKWVYGYSTGKLYKEELYENGRVVESKKID